MTQQQGNYTPRVNALEKLLRVMTEEQLVFLGDLCQEVIERSGYGQVVIEISNGHVRFVSAGMKYELPKVKHET